MSITVNKSVTLTVILVLIQCIKVSDLTTKPEEKFSLKKENCEPCSAKVIFKCHGYCYKMQLEDLKQWKRRRRSKGLVTFDSEKGASARDKRNPLDNDFVKTGKQSLNSEVLTLSTAAYMRISPSLSLLGRFKKKWPVHLWRRYLFTDDYLILINPHWLKFPPPSDVLNYCLGGLYIVMTLIGTSGNGLVLVLYYRCRSLRTPGNILVANLALSDFLMLAKTPIFIFNSFNLGPALGKTGCVIYGFVGGLTGCTSIATLAAIALDRYWAIAKPFEGLSALTAIRARILAIGAWIYAGLFASIPALDIGYGRYVPEGYLTSCSFDYLTEELAPKYFIFTFFCAAWLAPFCTITYCYTNILRVVICQRSVSTTGNDRRLSSRHVKEQAKKKAEMKLAILVIAVIALFFVSWTPYAVVALLGIFGKKELLSPTVSMVPALFCKTAACINPFVYIITHPKFRKEIRNLIYKDKSKRYNDTMKSVGYTTEASQYHRPSKDSSETDVEEVVMKDIPFQTGVEHKRDVKSVSARVTEREGSQKSISMKSFEEEIVAPPSWFTKPQFSKKKSFHRRSTRSVVSFNTDPSIL